MSFKNNWGGVRAWGRKIVLPVDEIKDLLKEHIFNKYSVNKVIDFGAGSLYWSEWFREVLGKERVFPVDIVFKNAMPETDMVCFASVDNIPKEGFGHSVLFYMCDVMHHLSEEEWIPVKKAVFPICDFIVIKDISCHYKFKNWMNKMHDRIINGERIYDVKPEMLLDDLRKQGFKCIYKDIHKLWYSHFIILAVKS